MARINLLDRATAELIAAGEVIERPASVVKELVENSIDAGASGITVEIKSGGIRYIRVTDNGCGISPEDIPTAFLRHATSKVCTAEDLNSILTLGFRGEALASVGAVARVSLISREPQGVIGSAYTFEGGFGGELTESGCPAGTTIIVRDLFYNVPARMKFMKKDSTEGAAVAALMERLAISRPDISFRFIREGAQKLFTPGDGKLLSAVYSVYGEEFASGLIPVSYEAGGLRLDGFISKPECCRPARSMQHYFINDRYIRSQTMLAALEEAYRNSAMVGKYPSCVLRLYIPAGSVDVNVHPAKLEVKLSDERMVFSMVREGCAAALASLGRATMAADTAVGRKLNYFEITHKPVQGTQQHITAKEYREALADGNSQVYSNTTLHSNFASDIYAAQLRERRTATDNTVYEFSGGHAAPLPEPEPRQTPRRDDYIPPSETSDSQTASQSIRNTQVAEENPQIILIGEVFSTYIIAQQGNELLLIDKHAAHERIIFNRLKAEQASGGVQRQLLIAPVKVTLGRQAHQAALDNLDKLSEAGFCAEDFGGSDIILREIPAVLGTAGGEEAFVFAVEALVEGRNDLGSLYDELLHSIACKAAVKGNTRDFAAEQQRIIEMLEADTQIRNCPHGRPVVVSLTRRELDRMFGRIQ